MAISRGQIIPGDPFLDNYVKSLQSAVENMTGLMKHKDMIIQEEKRRFSEAAGKRADLALKRIEADVASGLTYAEAYQNNWEMFSSSMMDLGSSPEEIRRYGERISDPNNMSASDLQRTWFNETMKTAQSGGTPNYSKVYADAETRQLAQEGITGPGGKNRQAAVPPGYKTPGIEPPKPPEAPAQGNIQKFSGPPGYTAPAMSPEEQEVYQQELARKPAYLKMLEGMNAGPTEIAEYEDTHRRVLNRDFYKERGRKVIEEFQKTQKGNTPETERGTTLALRDAAAQWLLEKGEDDSIAGRMAQDLVDEGMGRVKGNAFPTPEGMAKYEELQPILDAVKKRGKGPAQYTIEVEGWLEDPQVKAQLGIPPEATPGKLAPSQVKIDPLFVPQLLPTVDPQKASPKEVVIAKKAVSTFYNWLAPAGVKRKDQKNYIKAREELVALAPMLRDGYRRKLTEVGPDGLTITERTAINMAGGMLPGEDKNAAMKRAFDEAYAATQREAIANKSVMEQTKASAQDRAVQKDIYLDRKWTVDIIGTDDGTGKPIKAKLSTYEMVSMYIPMLAKAMSGGGGGAGAEEDFFTKMMFQEIWGPFNKVALDLTSKMAAEGKTPREIQAASNNLLNSPVGILAWDSLLSYASAVSGGEIKVTTKEASLIGVSSIFDRIFKYLTGRGGSQREAMIPSPSYNPNWNQEGGGASGILPEAQAFTDTQIPGTTPQAPSPTVAPPGNAPAPPPPPKERPPGYSENYFQKYFGGGR